jgi:CheY-like chemotaxis protein/nitrogen-specific signal transduction histidine kinase
MVFVLSFISQGVRLEQMETKRIKELDDAKTKLYTNITHEFRTPLTIITGMNDLIRKDPERWLDEGCETIDRNAGILLNLVNQMLDLAKLDAGTMPVKMIRSDVNLYLRYIVELFRSVAASSGISLNYYSPSLAVEIDYDPEKLMHIISNLISNSLKFTTSPGRIDLRTCLRGDEIFEIRVTDTGSGIPEDFLPYVFDRFSQSEQGRSTAGSGLGLALTKEIVTLLGGTINVESVFGTGTEFTVNLPVSRTAGEQEAPNPDELRNWMLHMILSKTRREVKADPVRHEERERPMLLLVEDNDDVIRYLMTIFADDYVVIAAGNGEEGIDKALEYIPDIIVSDILMPVMDGIRMLEVIKNDFRTSHIPVVLLTARADISSRLEGIEAGADAYISKPFNSEELRVQVRMLVAMRKQLHERYAAIDHLILPEDRSFRFDDKFMNQVRDIMISNLSNEALDIPHICQALNLSRTQLYRKFKSLTNLTVTQYLLMLRLHKARSILSGKQVTVAEAAYKTGFRNVSHFSRTFTREFGLNPSELLR